MALFFCLFLNRIGISSGECCDASASSFAAAAVLLASPLSRMACSSSRALMCSASTSAANSSRAYLETSKIRKALEILKFVNVDDFPISKTCRVRRAAVGMERSPSEKLTPPGGCIIFAFFLLALASVLLFHLAAAFFTHFSSVSLSPVR